MIDSVKPLNLSAVGSIAYFSITQKHILASLLPPALHILPTALLSNQEVRNHEVSKPFLPVVVSTAMLGTAIPLTKAANPTDQCPRFQFNPLDDYKKGMKYSFFTPSSSNPKT